MPRESIRKTWAICEYLKDKLPEGWKIHSPAGQEYATDVHWDNNILCYKKMNRNTLGVPFALEEDPDRAAQIILHTIWGTHAKGYEHWDSVKLPKNRGECSASL